ncbi:DNA primase [Dehalococcoides mccartyi]|jgi:DNA primase|uniref:DNA primase n=2 Tax=Dehalococcoides mccartyi TaxID=61435 RepID=A0A142V966_9CHLR|nr:DNA primase [Dehalococcoides mccartyi]AGG07620.1 DNA primase [Dehalococcoides mccartyi BTF08]AII60652.1 DNA primase [Dehalococcoides mccartyi CG5]AMU86318.1 DNA primase [Dehalococcoides mccartyi]AOV99152.1 DNA primase [Dehalococcoides mccartyi]KSV16822.1 DNA primase [Dehalococcoides mccartyi]
MNDAVEEIKQKLDIVSFIGQYTKLTKAGRTMRGICPFHSEKHGSFFVYPEAQNWHCFGACNTGGDIFAFVMKKEGLDFKAALELLAEKAGVSLPSQINPAIKDQRDRLYEINLSAAQYYHNLLLNSPQAENARIYLNSRGLNEQSLADFQLGYALADWQGLYDYLKERSYSDEDLLKAGVIVRSDEGRIHDRFRNNIIYPIANYKGQIAGFGARVMDNSQPKYRNSPQTDLFDKSSLLYGLHLASASIRENNRAIIVEGYMDAIMSHQGGFTNTVACMGTALTERQIALIKRQTKNLVLGLDSDSAGEEATLRAIDYENQMESEIRVAVPEGGKDPDELIRHSPQSWQEILDNARPLLDYIFEHSQRGLDLNSAAGKSKLTDHLLPIISKMEDGVRQSHYLGKLAEIVSTSQNRILERLKKLKNETRNAKVTEKEAPSGQAPKNPALEEYALSLLFTSAEVTRFAYNLHPEYLEIPQYRELLAIYNQSAEKDNLRPCLDENLREYYDNLMNKNPANDNIEDKFYDLCLRLRERYLRNLAVKLNQALSEINQPETTEYQALNDQCVKVNEELRSVFSLKDRRNQKQRRQ